MSAQASSPVLHMSKSRLDALIDREAKRRLGISGLQFKRRLCIGALSDDIVAVRDIAMLVKLGSAKNNNGYSGLR